MFPWKMSQFHVGPPWFPCILYIYIYYRNGKRKIAQQCAVFSWEASVMHFPLGSWNAQGLQLNTWHRPSVTSCGKNRWSSLPGSDGEWTNCFFPNIVFELGEFCCWFIWSVVCLLAPLKWWLWIEIMWKWCESDVNLNGSHFLQALFHGGWRVLSSSNQEHLLVTFFEFLWYWSEQ